MRSAGRQGGVVELFPYHRLGPTKDFLNKGQERLNLARELPRQMSQDLRDDLDAYDGILFVILSYESHKKIDNLYGVRFESCRRVWGGPGRRGRWGERSRQSVENLQDAVAQFLFHVRQTCSVFMEKRKGDTHLLRRVALEDAWSPQNIDEYGHNPSKEVRVYRADSIVVKTVAQD